MMGPDVYARSLELHRARRGKISVEGRVPVNSMADLALAYTPGVAEPCREIKRDRSAAYEVTSKGNMVAVITDGSAVLGLGDIGPDAALPVMEGKAVLFKRFAGIEPDFHKDALFRAKLVAMLDRVRQRLTDRHAHPVAGLLTHPLAVAHLTQHALHKLDILVQREKLQPGCPRHASRV